MYNVLIVEDDPIAKKLFSLYIESNNEFKLSAVLESAAMAEVYCCAHKIDMIVMYICTSGHSSGLEAAIKIKRNMPNIKIIIVTSQPEVNFIQRARDGMIDSFWYKITEETELTDVLKRTAAGESVYLTIRPSVKIGLISDSELTELEFQILRELTSGEPTKIIAKRLNLSDRTIDNNINRMLEKTGFPTRTKLACAAVDSGIVIKDI